MNMTTAGNQALALGPLAMSLGSGRVFPPKVLLALTALVLLVHLALLQGSPLSLGPSQAQGLRPFITRSIELAATESAAQAVTPPAAAPVRRKAVAPAGVERQLPPATPEGSGDAVPRRDAALDQERASTRPEDATLQDPPPADVEPPAPVPRPSRDQLAVASAYSVPGSVRLKYNVSANKFPFGANAELLWKQDGTSYEAWLTISAFGQARVQNSRGQVTPQGLAPLRFSDKFRSEVAAHFNREQGKVTFSANTPDVPLLSGAQDHLSILIQLGAMVAGEPSHYPSATTLSFQAIGSRDADTWLFAVENEEKLVLPGGELNTLKLVRNPRKEFDQKVELWLAPALGYLPARIRITESNGDSIDQKWSATEPLV
jgi:hypothetical protein